MTEEVRLRIQAKGQIGAVAEHPGEKPGACAGCQKTICKSRERRIVRRCFPPALKTDGEQVPISGGREGGGKIGEGINFIVGNILHSLSGLHGLH